MVFAGVDIETTGTDPDAGHRLIQIGIAFAYSPTMGGDVQPIGDINIQADALAVNHFTLARIGAAPLQTDVDTRITFQLSAAGYKAGDITPVGWNVGGFDMVFVKKELPKTAAFFSYRVFDLTTIAIMESLWTGTPYPVVKIKLASKVVECLGRDESHDALYDAEAALIILDYYKGKIKV